MGKMSSFTATNILSKNDYLPILQTSGSTTSNMKTTIDALKDAILANLGNGAGVHNSIYRGKNLGTSVTADQYNTIDSGNFEDLFIGDYWTVNSKVYRIAAFDYWYNKGDTACNKHHVVLVPDSTLGSAKMNNENTTVGGYVGSDIYTGANENTGLSSARSTISTAFSGHLLSHREYLSNAVSNGYPSAGAWTDSVVDLMNEPMVYGSYIFTGINSGTNIPMLYTTSTGQLPLFALRPDYICIRSAWWLRDVVSSSYFANAYYYGYCASNSASNSYGVRPAFAICKTGV